MMLGFEQLTFTLRLTAIVLPVALYFLVLGLLNSRKHPQLLTSRQDFALLMTTMSPLVLVPVLGLLHGGWGVGLAAVLLGGLGVLLLTDPRGGPWVIYNLSSDQAFDVTQRCLTRLGVTAIRTATGMEFVEPTDAADRANHTDTRIAHTAGAAAGNVAGPKRVVLDIRPFPLLRNVSLRLRNASPPFAIRFREELSRQLAAMEAPTTPMAMSLLIVATAMMIAPLTMVVQKAPELVRLLTDLGH